MTVFLTRRLLQAVVVLIIVSILVFAVMRFLTGDPLLIYISQNDLQQISQQDMDKLRHQFGLDKPVLIQYLDWITGVLRGDFGTSIVYNDQVNKILAERLPVTLHLGILALIFSSIFGILAGTLAAIRRGKWLDTVMTFLANVGITVPVFWLGILLIYFFSLKLGWLPTNGYTSPFTDFWKSTRQIIMPVLCLSVVSMAAGARQTRSSILEVVRQDYIRTAWAKGLKERDVILIHTLKNGLIPVVTFIGMNVAHIFGGSVLVETVFNVPGMGRLMVTAVFARDLPIVQSCCLIIAAVVIFANLLVDISYSWLDPRIRFS